MPQQFYAIRKQDDDLEHGVIGALHTIKKARKRMDQTHHKYYKKVNINGRWRYFYTPEEYEAYITDKSSGKKKKATDYGVSREVVKYNTEKRNRKIREDAKKTFEERVEKDRQERKQDTEKLKNKAKERNKKRKEKGRKFADKLFGK